jgi:hypothetical protein
MGATMLYGAFPEALEVLPTATQAQLVRQDTPVRTVLVAPAGFGELASCQDWPFHVSTSVNSFEVEVLENPTPVQDVALKQLTSMMALLSPPLNPAGTDEARVQVDPFQVSMRFCPPDDVAPTPDATQNEEPTQETEKISTLS